MASDSQLRSKTAAGQMQLSITLDGRPDHAGTTPINMRLEALTGVAECILAAETLAKAPPPLVITVGRIQVDPDLSNSIPQHCSFTVDLRHPDDSARSHAADELQKILTHIASRRDLGLA